MARAPKQVPGVNPGSLAVESVPVAGARPLLTFEQDHPVWGGKVAAQVEGAIVRVRPPEGASDERVAELVESFRKGGAAAVKVLPRRRSVAVVEPEGVKPRARVRDVAVGLAREASVSDVGKLVSLVEEIAGRVGI